MKVEIYTALYQNVNGKSVCLSAFTNIDTSGLNKPDAIARVKQLYGELKLLGNSYKDVNVDLDNGYVELVIFFNENKNTVLRVYIK